MSEHCIILHLQISLLDSAVHNLKANLKSAADLISLPTTVEELQKVKQNGKETSATFYLLV